VLCGAWQRADLEVVRWPVGCQHCANRHLRVLQFQCVAVSVCCSVLQRVAVCSSVLKYIVVCCNVLTLNVLQNMVGFD